MPSNTRYYAALRERQERELVRAVRWLGVEATHARLREYLGWPEDRVRRTLARLAAAGQVVAERVYVAPTPREREAEMVRHTTTRREG